MIIPVPIHNNKSIYMKLALILIITIGVMRMVVKMDNILTKMVIDKNMAQSFCLTAERKHVNQGTYYYNQGFEHVYYFPKGGIFEYGQVFVNSRNNNAIIHTTLMSLAATVGHTNIWVPHPKAINKIIKRINHEFSCFGIILSDKYVKEHLMINAMDFDIMIDFSDYEYDMKDILTGISKIPFGTKFRKKAVYSTKSIDFRSKKFTHGLLFYDKISKVLDTESPSFDHYGLSNQLFRVAYRVPKGFAFKSVFGSTSIPFVALFKSRFKEQLKTAYRRRLSGIGIYENSIVGTKLDFEKEFPKAKIRPYL